MIGLTTARTAGATKVSFPLATNKMIGKGPDRKKLTTWHRVVFFNNETLTQVVDQSFSRGALVFVEGELSTRRIEQPDGAPPHYVTEVVVGYNGRMFMLRQPRSQDEQDDENVELPSDDAGEQR